MCALFAPSQRRRRGGPCISWAAHQPSAISRASISALLCCCAAEQPSSSARAAEPRRGRRRAAEQPPSRGAHRFVECVSPFLVNKLSFCFFLVIRFDSVIARLIGRPPTSSCCRVGPRRPARPQPSPVAAVGRLNAASWLRPRGLRSSTMIDRSNEGFNRIDQRKDDDARPHGDAGRAPRCRPPPPPARPCTDRLLSPHALAAARPPPDDLNRPASPPPAG